MRKGWFFVWTGFYLLCCTMPAAAHFGMVIPSDNMVMQNDERTVKLQLSFSHPMEMVGMNLVKPRAFGVVANGKKKDLGSALTRSRSWVTRPGRRITRSSPGYLYVLYGTATLLGTI